MQVLLILRRTVEKVQQFEAQFRVFKCLAPVQKNEAGVVVKEDQVVKEVFSFLKWTQEYFPKLCNKEKEGGRTYARVVFMCDQTVNNLEEMLRE